MADRSLWRSRWSPLNERQHAHLRRLADGGDFGDWEPGEWRSAYGLRDRGLLAIQRGEDGAHLQVAEAGTFYLRNGHHPEHRVHAKRAAADATGGKPSTGPTPYSERPFARARRAKATELVERLVAEGRVIVSDPDEDEIGRPPSKTPHCRATAAASMVQVVFTGPFGRGIGSTAACTSGVPCITYGGVTAGLWPLPPWETDRGTALRSREKPDLNPPQTNASPRTISAHRQEQSRAAATCSLLCGCPNGVWCTPTRTIPTVRFG